MPATGATLGADVGAWGGTGVAEVGACTGTDAGALCAGAGDPVKVLLSLSNQPSGRSGVGTVTGGGSADGVAGAGTTGVVSVVGAGKGGGSAVRAIGAGTTGVASVIGAGAGVAIEAGPAAATSTNGVVAMAAC